MRLGLPGRRIKKTRKREKNYQIRLLQPVKKKAKKSLSFSCLLLRMQGPGPILGRRIQSLDFSDQIQPEFHSCRLKCKSLFPYPNNQSSISIGTTCCFAKHWYLDAASRLLSVANCSYFCSKCMN